MTGFDRNSATSPISSSGSPRRSGRIAASTPCTTITRADIVVRSPGSVVVGNQGVIAATMATLHEFPDRTLLGEDVIWVRHARDRDAVLAPAAVDRDP